MATRKRTLSCKKSNITRKLKNPDDNHLVIRINSLENKLSSDSGKRKNVKLFSSNETTKCVSSIHSSCGPKLKNKKCEEAPRNLILAYFNNEYSTVFKRLYSFRNWISSISATSLADAGFYCVEAATEKCQCYSCGIIIVAAELDGQRPHNVHKNLSPHCQHVNRVTVLTSPEIRNSTQNQDSENRSSEHLLRSPSDLACANILQNVGGNDPVDTRGRIDALNFPEVQVTSANSRSDNETDNAGALQITYSERNPDMTREQSRRESFRYWPHQGMMDTDLLVDAGFFFTGTEDIVRCFHCDIGLADWNNDDDPWTEHARHSPDCPFLRRQKPRQFIEQIQKDWAKVYAPKRPDMMEPATRLKTFINSSWPEDEVVQTPRELVAAGFYFTGTGDTVRCHYCDGGLREWEPNDNPWVEHARWFPFCKFVLKEKGMLFIQNAATGNANTDVRRSNIPAAYSSEGLSMSFVDKCRIKEQKNPLFTAAAQSIKEMGYSKSVIQMAINEYIAEKGCRDFNSNDLMTIIMEKEDNGELAENKETIAALSRSLSSGEESSEDEMKFTPDALRKENEYLQSKILCISCMKNERCMVHIPCGHRLMCETCSVTTNTCTHCSRPIERNVKTYLS